MYLHVEITKFMVKSNRISRYFNARHMRVKLVLAATILFISRDLWQITHNAFGSWDREKAYSASASSLALVLQLHLSLNKSHKIYYSPHIICAIQDRLHIMYDKIWIWQPCFTNVKLNHTTKYRGTSNVTSTTSTDNIDTQYFRTLNIKL